eukprot:210511_1
MLFHCMIADDQLRKKKESNTDERQRPSGKRPTPEPMMGAGQPFGGGFQFSAGFGFGPFFTSYGFQNGRLNHVPRPPVSEQERVSQMVFFAALVILFLIVFW